MARQERVPAPHGRTDDLLGTGFGDCADLLVGDLRVVLPVEQGDFFGKRFEDLGVFEGDAAPHHRSSAPGFEVAARADGAVGVHGGDVDPFGEGFGAALAEVEGLVRADVELVRAEQLQVVIDEPTRQVEGAVVAGVEHVVVHAVDEHERLVGGLRELAEVAERLRAQGHVEMPERGDRRHELDAAVGAVVVECEDVARGERYGAVPGLTHAVESESVLDVELELVDFAQAELVDPGLEPVEGGDAPAGHAEVIASRSEGGLVLDV